MFPYIRLLPHRMLMVFGRVFNSAALYCGTRQVGIRSQAVFDTQLPP